MTRIYVGIADGLKREVFRSVTTPTWDTHYPKYLACIGPFRTMRGARFMRDYGQGNPHLQCVADAEVLAKQYEVQS
jgi:hypothetical protein